MKTTLIIFLIIGITSFTVIKKTKIEHEDLKTTCKVLVKLTNDAIDNRQNHLVAIYYNTYKAIDLYNEIPEECEKYFDQIKEIYIDDLGKWTLGLDFPPRYYNSISSRTYTHKEVETLNMLQELNLTLEDLEQVKLFKGIQENTIDLKLLKTVNPNNIKQLNDNLNKLKIEDIDYSKLKLLSNEKLNIENFKGIIKN
jgi:hypothetical protein